MAERPLPTMRATAIGTRTPMSASAPASSRRSKRTGRSYRSPVPLDERDLLPDPLAQFAAWFDEAPGVREAMALATADSSGAPSVRMVLLKGFDERGFVFHTNYASRKGRELEANPQAALLFYWRELGRQVRIEGTVERTSREDSEAYYRTRPPGARLSAWASPQSEPVADRAELEARVERGPGAVRRRPAATGALGRPPRRPARVRVLGARRRPPPRPLPLRARRRRVADPAPRAVARLEQVTQCY